MNKDIRVELGFFDHRKTRRLIDRFGLEAAWGLLRLWSFAAARRPDGSLSGMTAADIIDEMHYKTDDPEAVVRYMSSDQCRWLEEGPGGLCLHDWHEHNPWCAGFQKRSDESRMLVMKRHHPKLFKELSEKGITGISKKDYAAYTVGIRDVKVVCSPIPLPIPKSKDMSEAESKDSGKKSKRSATPSNPSIRIIQDYLKTSFEKKYGSPPVMNYPAIGKQLKYLLETEKFTEEALKELIDWFLISPKAKDHPTPAAAISADTVQRWQVACPEK